MRGEREGTKNKLADEQDALAVYERKRSAAQTSHGRLLALKQVCSFTSQRSPLPAPQRWREPTRGQLADRPSDVCSVTKIYSKLGRRSFANSRRNTKFRGTTTT